MTPHRRAVLDNAIAHYYDRIQSALDHVREHGTGGDGTPEQRLPQLDGATREFFSVSGLSSTLLGTHHGVRLVLLDLMRNPGTRTTKTFASLVIVARAVRHIRGTGERLMLLTPSSANKATALRDAVLRAVDAGLVTRDQLRIACVVPEESVAKVWHSRLAADPGLRERNPVVVHDGPGAAVKALAQEGAETCAEELRRVAGVRIWHTLDLDNYRAADTVRAFYEAEFLPAPDGRVRWHAHAVSSAFGLFGHHLGVRLLAAEPGARDDPPGYLLVQHLRTPDMVQDLRSGSASPPYRRHPVSGLFVQSADPAFPAAAFDPRESIDPTFYTERPATAPRMSALIREQGGGGIVVSLHECLVRYAQVRALVARADVQLPADPRTLREWSLVMVVTGTLLAVERGLVRADEVVLHGSGSYDADDYTPLPSEALRPAGQLATLADVLHKAAGVQDT
ncbi:DUF6002 family protein [Streptomyces luteireticuli]|uniref:DUF6002 family protein n=1 Tax=Streptomyces luteireticuli TaxID=173858 RepID=UPI0035565EA1